MSASPAPRSRTDLGRVELDHDLRMELVKLAEQWSEEGDRVDFLGRDLHGSADVARLSGGGIGESVERASRPAPRGSAAPPLPASASIRPGASRRGECQAPAQARAIRRATVVWLTRSARAAASVLPSRATARKYRRSFQSSIGCRFSAFRRYLRSAILQNHSTISLLTRTGFGDYLKGRAGKPRSQETNSNKG